MEENGNTAEHELLRMIEGTEDNKTADGKTSSKSGYGSNNAIVTSVKKKKSLLKAKVKPDSMPLSFGLTDWMGKISIEGMSSRITLQGVNKALIVVILALLSWCTYEVIVGIVHMNDIPRFEISGVKKTADMGQPVKTALKEYAYYVDSILGRNMFTPDVKRTKKRETKISTVQAMVAGLRLVGISWAEEPASRYAMVEVVKTEITNYVQEGEIISGFLVKEIGPQKVLLSFEGEEVDLR